MVSSNEIQIIRTELLKNKYENELCNILSLYPNMNNNISGDDNNNNISNNENNNIQDNETNEENNNISNNDNNTLDDDNNKENEEKKITIKINKLNNIIELLKTTIDLIHAKSEKVKIGFTLDDIDIYMYKKPWNKMQPFHKLKKIKEFFKDKIEAKEYDNLIKELTPMIYNGELNKKNIVTYDPEQCEILDTKIVEIDEEQKKYEIKLLK